MIGTLVVSLPSSHTGGELLIEHNGKTVAYQASATEVSVAAFYAGCRHEVKPVRTGYRVTFSCNLLLGHGLGIGVNLFVMRAGGAMCSSRMVIISSFPGNRPC